MSAEAVTRIYCHEPLTDDMVAALNEERSLADLAGHLEEIGYPVRRP